MNKQWERQFAEGLDELVDAQRYQLAKYLVEYGIEEGASINDISRASKRSSRNLSARTVTTLIDFYYASEGAWAPAPLQGTQAGLEHAMKQGSALI